jgi:hypothetical protein
MSSQLVVLICFYIGQKQVSSLNIGEQDYKRTRVRRKRS